MHVTDVVNALACCGSHEKSLGETFNLSQTITLEKMIRSLAYGINADRKIFRLPKYPVLVFARALGWIPGFPLSVSRVEALTCRSFYSSDKIKTTLGFQFSKTLEEGFVLFAKKR